MNSLSCLVLGWLVSWSFCVGSCRGWTQAELDLFDLVEEIGQNFYDVLQVEQTASSSEIRRAYRRLSLLYHPDKSSEPDAAEKFRKIGAVAEVLRDEELRAMYDQVLVEGLPDWRQPIYYYRRVRKMTIWEILVLLLAIATFAQFLIGWAQYFEKWLVLNELREKKARKEQRTAKARKQTSLQLEAEIVFYEQLANACIPHYSRLLPVIIIKKLFHLVLFFFFLFKQYFTAGAKQQPEDVALENESPKTTSTVTRSSSRGKQGRERRLVNAANNSKNKAEEPLNGEHTEKENKMVDSTQPRNGLKRSSDQERNRCGLHHLSGISRDNSEKSRTADNCRNKIELSSALTVSGSSTDSSGKVASLPREDKRHLDKIDQTASLPVDQDCTNVRKTTITCAVRSKTDSHQNLVRSAKGVAKSTKAVVGSKPKNQSKVAEGTATNARNQTLELQKQAEHSDSTTVMQNFMREEASPSKATQSERGKEAGSLSIDTSRNRTVDGNQTADENRTVDSFEEGEPWSQFQQQQLEWALRQYPRNEEKRWQLIAMNVPGKSEAECKKRYRVLVDMVHRKKSSCLTKEH